MWANDSYGDCVTAAGSQSMVFDMSVWLKESQLIALIREAVALFLTELGYKALVTDTAPIIRGQEAAALA